MSLATTIVPLSDNLVVTGYFDSSLCSWSMGIFTLSSIAGLEHTSFSVTSGRYLYQCISVSVDVAVWQLVSLSVQLI